MKQFVYAIYQHSEKRIDIHCKVTFGFKYKRHISNVTEYLQVTVCIWVKDH